ncbi:MAG: GDSL-type esterase/lipase family protein [Pelosinus sp.]|nr:GDSL-type esterase/lipase family protein [Pelosinus sp.]
MKLLRIIFIIMLFSTLTAIGYAQDGKIQLQWSNAEDAVMYEFEVASVSLSKNQPAPQKKTIYRTTEVYTPGLELDLNVLGGKNLRKLYYRVRPLDLDKNPLGPYTASVSLAKGLLNPQKPAITPYPSHRPTPLYPVYAWIPVLNAARYDIEVTNKMPENPNGNTGSVYRINTYSINEGFDCYETQPYSKPGTYYWRVIAIDEAGQPMGNYSDATMFKIPNSPARWASFGDSITHGGGAISNPPTDERFDYTSYLPFPVKNIGKSGDTAAALAARFDADVLPFSPQYLIILGGSNSIRGGTSGEAVIASLETIKQKCIASGITPIFLTLPPLNPERIQRVFNQPTAEDWSEEMAKVNAYIKTQPYFVDIYSRLVNGQGILPVKYSQDGLHPDISGKKIMGQTVRDYVTKLNLK